MIDNHIVSLDGQPHDELNAFLAFATEEIVLFSPYIRLNMLQSILPERQIPITVITTLKVRDLWYGASDIELYPYAKRKNIKLFINNRIHLKAFVSDWRECIYGSANITGRGLGMVTNYNYELLSQPTMLGHSASMYLRSIMAGSVLMTDDMYEDAKTKLNKLGPKPIIDELDIDHYSTQSDFLISALPMSSDLEELFYLYEHEFDNDDTEKVQCAIHDLALYSIPMGLEKMAFYGELKRSFFKSRFIIELVNQIDGNGLYFGTVKQWIQANCTNVPVPTRRDLTENIQVLYHWIVSLSDGEFLVDQPRHSQRLYRAVA